MKKHLLKQLKYLLILPFALLVMAAAQAQQMPVKGQVTDEQGGGLPGVTILVKGSNVGTTTDPNGNFSLNVPNGNASLVVSFVGYLNKEVAVNNRSSLNVVLQPDAKALEEVVVVGYGTQRKRDITSAVTNINMDDIGEVPASNVTRLIQGQAPGVAVKQKTGIPGGQFEVKIRGIGSLGAGSNPLYVIDGFPVGTSVGQNLNPNDIESITILKDAASTAIYGARGSNGVVLITTKSAKEGKISLQVSADYGVQNIPDSRKVTVLNGVEFAQFKKETFTDKFVHVNKRQPTLEEIPLGYRFPEQTKHSTNWYDAILHKDAPYADYNMTLSSGKGPIKSVFSLGYFTEQGTIIKTNYDRISGRANLNGEVNKYISLGFNLNGSYSKQNVATTEGRSALVGSTLLMDPREPVYDEKGQLRPYINGVDGVFGFPNPVFALQNIKRRRNNAEALSNAYVEISPFKGLKFRSSVNAKMNYFTARDYVPSTIGLAVANGSSGAPPRIATAVEINEQLQNLAADQVLTYAPTLGEAHQLDFMLGFSAQEEKLYGVNGSANTFPDDLVPYLTAGSLRSATSYEYGWKMQAYLGRVNYAFRDKYLFSASMRREGSSRFGANNRYGDFPAASIGWRLSEESFMPEFSWLADLKLRASWGKTGNNDIGNYSHLAFMNANNYIIGNNFAPGKVVSSLANAELGWEKSDQLDLGLDLSLLDNRVVFTAEYYNKITNDMLLPIATPAVSGFTTALSNIGKVQNRGVELAINYSTRIGQVNFRTSPNITFNRNKILAIKGQNDMLWSGGFYGGYNVQKVGRPIGMIYGYKKLGIFNTQAEIDAAPKQDGAIPGSMKFWDADGNGVISYDTKDMVEIGNPNPDFMWAWNFSADYKKIDLSVQFMGAQNYDIYRNIEASTMNMDGVFNVLDKAKDRWRSPENPGSNPNHKNSQGGTNDWKWGRESSERYIYDASHIWVKNVTLGYGLPRFGAMPESRIFLNAANLFLITNYPGNNPDASVRGGNELNNDDETYPIPRTFSLGARVTF